MSPVQVPAGVTLTIEPGVVVMAAPGVTDMFVVNGTISAVGLAGNRIVFDGGGGANFFSAKSSTAATFVNVDNAMLRNGGSIWPPTGYEQYGHLTLRHSEIRNATAYSYLWYPGHDDFIENNTFINSAGFSTGHNAANVYIRNNRFVSKNGSLYWVSNWAAYSGSQTIVQNNSFEDVGTEAVELPAGYSSAALDATSNYWGTTDESTIQSMIHDHNDDITAAGTIPYAPFLDAAAPDVPTTTAPEQPNLLTVTPGDSSAKVTWSRPSSDGGSPITSYTVQSYLTMLPVSSVTIPAGGPLSATIGSLTNGNFYSFSVVANNSLGAGLPSPLGGLSEPNKLPGLPTDLYAWDGSSNVLGAGAFIQWNPDGAATGYVVTAYQGSTAVATVAAQSGGALFFSGLLTYGLPYTFTVHATSPVGDGPETLRSNPVVPAATPAAPTGVTVQPGDGQATLSWISPADNKATPIIGYVVTVDDGVVIEGSRVFDSTATTETILGLTNGMSYRFTVEAKTAYNHGPASLPTTAVTPTAPPPPAPSPPQPAVPPPATSPQQATAPPAATSDPARVIAARAGYRMLGAAGNVYGFGDAAFLGDPSGTLPGGQPATNLVTTPSGNGYWVVTSAGNVFAYGDAPPLGGNPALGAGEKVTSVSSSRDGMGYWLFTNTGRVFAYGDAPFLGDMAGTRLNGPVLGSVVTPSGNGYYMVASDGGIFTFGDAAFHGSMGGQHLNGPVVGLAPDPDGVGYWLVANDGGIFSFEAGFQGSMGGSHLNKPMIGMVAYGNGYLMVASDGGIFDFSDKPFVGSLGGNPPPVPVVAVTPLNR